MLMPVIANRTVTLLDKEPKYNFTPYNLLFDNYNIMIFVRKTELEKTRFALEFLFQNTFVSRLGCTKWICNMCDIFVTENRISVGNAQNVSCAATVNYTHQVISIAPCKR